MTALDIAPAPDLHLGEAVLVAHTDTMDRADWLDTRRHGIGGSDAATICGLDTYTSPYELWCDKVTGGFDDSDSEAAHWGRILEDVVATETARRDNLTITRHPAIYAHHTRTWQLANFDGVIPTHPEHPGPGIYEGKTAGHWTASQWDNDQVPDRYIVQGQHYLAVTGFQWVAYSCLLAGQRLVTRVVHRDQALIDQLIELEARFWQQVTDRTPPAPDGTDACTEFLAGIRATEGKTLTVDPADVDPLLDARRALDEQIKTLTEQKTALENQLKVLLDDAEIAAAPDGRVLFTWKTQTRRDIDRDVIKRAGPYLAELATTTTHRRLHIPKPRKETP